MNFISNVFGVTPVVGAAQAVILYAEGDKEGGNRVLYQLARESAVDMGGQLGSSYGLGGAAVGGACGGCLVDCVATVATGESHGIVKDCENVVIDIQRGEDPSLSLFITGAHIGLDTVSGMSAGFMKNTGKMDSFGGTKIKIMEKSLKLIVEEVAKIAEEKREISRSARRLCEALKAAEQGDGETTKGNNEKKADKSKMSGKETGKNTSQSGGQPPERDKDNNKKSDGCNEPDPFSYFLKLLEKILTLYGDNIEKFYGIFKNLTPGQRYYLKKLIKRLMNYGTLEAVLELVIKIFAQHFPSKFTFTNFLSLMEFVQAYINNEVEELNYIYQQWYDRSHLELPLTDSPIFSAFSELSIICKVEEHKMITQGTGRLRIPYQERLDFLLLFVLNEPDLVREIVEAFNNIWVQIESQDANYPVYPNFRDKFSAVYHYFKHRIFHGGGILSVSGYYGWMRFLLQKIEKLKEYSDLIGPNTLREIVYEICVSFGKEIKRIRIIIKIQGGKIVLLSCYVVSKDFDGDKDGDIFIDGKRKM